MKLSFKDRQRISVLRIEEVLKGLLGVVSIRHSLTNARSSTRSSTFVRITSHPDDFIQALVDRLPNSSETTYSTHFINGKLARETWSFSSMDDVFSHVFIRKDAGESEALVWINWDVLQ